MRSTCDHTDLVRYWLTRPKAEVTQYMTRSVWSRVDRNHKSITVLLNNQEFFLIFLFNNILYVYSKRSIRYQNATKNFNNILYFISNRSISNTSYVFHTCSKRKRKRSDSILWQKPLHQQKCQKGKVTTQQHTKKFDYTAVADRLRTVSWSNYSHPTGVVNRFTGPPSH